MIGQVLSHSVNTNCCQISIPIGIKFGTQTIYVSQTVITVVNSLVYASAVNLPKIHPNINLIFYTFFFKLKNTSLPTFALNLADLGSADFSGGYQPRAVFFDIYTTPGAIYQAMTAQIVMPETVLGSSIPSASVCMARIYSVGVNAQCVQQVYVNGFQISYFQRFEEIQFLI